MSFIVNEEDGVALDVEAIVMVRRSDSGESCEVYMQGGHSVILNISFEEFQANILYPQEESTMVVNFSLDEDLN